MKRNLFFMLFASALLLTGCSDDDKKSIDELPYSELTPEQQKEKLEEQGLEFLEMANGIKSSEAIGAYESLSYLLELAEPPFFDPEQEVPVTPSSYSVEDIMFRYATVYGVYTWNKENRSWDKTESETEMKFVFPAIRNGSANNASLSITAKESDVMVEDEFFLPKSAGAKLVINDKQVGTISMNAEYSNKNQIPTKANLDTTLDKYVAEFTFNKGQTSSVTASVQYNGKNMISAGVSSPISMEEEGKFFEGNSDIEIKVLDNLEFKGTGDIAKYEKQVNSIKAGSEKEYEEQRSKIFNDNFSLTLADVAGGTKIATVVMQAKQDEYYEEDYESVLNLQFNDDTIVEADAYFSGFNKLIKEWEKFIDSF